MRVLFIHRPETDSQAIRQYITEAGTDSVALECTDDVLAGTDRLSEEKFNLLLLELPLPENPGLDAFFKARIQAPDLACVVLVRASDLPLGEAAVKAGAQDCLVADTLQGDALARNLEFACERQRQRNESDEVFRKTNRGISELQLELERLQGQIIQQERLHTLGEMAGGIAHDFNNALLPILGFCELLLAHPEELANQEKITNYLYKIKKGAEYAAMLVKRLGEVYSNQDQAQKIQPIDVNAVIQEAIAFTQPKWKDEAQGKGINIHFQTSLPDIPAITGNETDIREVLMSLILNSVDAMPQGGVVSISTRREGDMVAMEISDTGTGMTEEVRQRCLEPFYSTKGARGTGLGLTVVSGIVQRSRGLLEIQSEPGKGTCIIVRLKVQPQSPPAPILPLPRPIIAPLNILVVEDEPLVRLVLTEYLTGDGHVVETAGNGVEGLEKFRYRKFDLVVTDRAMPEMNGDQMAALIQHTSPDTPVILLTGFGDLMNAAGERPAGVGLVVTKPVSLDDLRQAIATVMAA